jgi:hypothetical protein
MARVQLKDSGVLFDEEQHTYLLNDKYLSGITGMLQRQFFPDEFEGISKAVLDAAAQYGTDIHRSCEDFDQSWINDGTQEVQDYIQICRENNLTHECSEYTVTDGENWASRVDKVYRVSENTFDLADIKTYGKMTAEKLEKVKWQLSTYKYLFLKVNPKCRVRNLLVIHLRNKMKKDGTFDHIANVIFVDAIPADIIEDLLATDLRGEQFVNPFGIPDEYKAQEAEIRELIQTKAEVEERLSQIKAKILEDMTAKNVKLWATDTMRLTRKLPTTRTAFDLQKFKKDNPDLNYDDYLKESQVSGSLLIAV